MSGDLLHKATALTRLMDQFQTADEAGEFGECCQDPCPACNFGQWLDTKVAEAQSAAKAAAKGSAVKRCPTCGLRCGVTEPTP